MANLGLLALAAGVGKGYVDQLNRQDEIDLQKKRFALEEQRAAREQQTYEDARSLQQGLKDASATRSIVQGDVVGDKGSQSFYTKGTLTPELQESLQAEADMRGEQTGKPVGLMTPRTGYGVTGMSKGNEITETAPDLAALNSPAAVLKRQQLSLSQAGKPIEAMQLEKAGLELKAATQKDADDATRRQISALQSHEDVADWISKTKGDGKDGKFKVKAVASPDGKAVTYHTIAEDGTTSPTGQTFKNDGAGLEEARTTLAGYLTPEMRQAHYKDLRESERKSKADDEKFKYMSAALDAKIETAKALSESKGQRFQAATVIAPMYAAANKSVSDAEKQIADLQKDVLFSSQAKNPDSTQAKHLASLQEDLAVKKSEQNFYKQYLGGMIGLGDISAPAKNTPTSGVIPPMGAPKPKADTQASNTKDGQFQILQQEFNKSTQALEKAKASGDTATAQRLTADLESLGREAKALGKSFQPTTAQPSLAQVVANMPPRANTANTAPAKKFTPPAYQQSLANVLEAQRSN